MVQKLVFDMMCQNMSNLWCQKNLKIIFVFCSQEFIFYLKQFENRKRNIFSTFFHFHFTSQRPDFTEKNNVCQFDFSKFPVKLCLQAVKIQMSRTEQRTERNCSKWERNAWVYFERLFKCTVVLSAVTIHLFVESSLHKLPVFSTSAKENGIWRKLQIAVKNFESSILDSVQELWTASDIFDVTLCADDGRESHDYDTT